MSQLSEKKHHLAVTIDKHVNKIIADGGGDEQLLASMYDQMSSFKQLIDTCSSEEMDILCQKYDGFYRFAKLLENLAGGIANKTVSIPK